MLTPSAIREVREAVLAYDLAKDTLACIYEDVYIDDMQPIARYLYTIRLLSQKKGQTNE